LDGQQSQLGCGDEYDRFVIDKQATSAIQPIATLDEIFRPMELKLVPVTAILQLRILHVCSNECGTKFKAVIWNRCARAQLCMD
jgi:hypothetical protein